jgi:subtilisin family serine protease
MNGEERIEIISEEYGDFIIDYRYNPQLLERFSNAYLHIMNDAYAIVHISLNLLPERIIREYSYSFIPKVLGLTSEVSIDRSGVGTIRNLPDFNLTGSGILIGIIDTGIDYLNPVFLNENGLTKIVSIWDQTIQSEGAYPFETYFGTEYVDEQINQAIASDNPLDIVPSMDFIGHGTMMAGVAVGNENEEVAFQGVAPQAELVVVKLRQAKEYLRKFYLIPADVAAYQENEVMWGVQYCLDVANSIGRPIVICIGLGTSQTSHTGQSNLGNFLSVVADARNVGIVTAIGNEGNLGRHYFDTVTPEEGKVSVELNVGANENGFSMELWGDFSGLYSIDILAPGGEYIPRIASGLKVSREISFVFEQTVIYVDYEIIEALSGNQLILLRFLNASEGIWKFTVYSQGDLSSSFHIWLPMGDFISKNTYFIQPNIYTTVLAPSTAFTPLAVTAYNPINGNLYANASKGYTTDNVVKPELAAPGVNYISPTLNGEFINYSGTGVAAAHTAGIIALFLEWAVVQENMIRVDTIVIKNFFIRGARRSENLVYPNRDWGYGILDIYNVFNVLRTGL